MTIQQPRTAAAGGDSLGDLRARLASVATVAELADVVRTHARRAAAADAATFVLREHDRCFYVDEDGIAPLWNGQRFPISECISGWAMTHGENVVVPDINLDERVPKAAYRPTFVRSLAMVPVGRPRAVAAIGAYWAERHQASASEIEGLVAVAGVAATTLERIGLDTAPWAPTFGGG